MALSLAERVKVQLCRLTSLPVGAAIIALVSALCAVQTARLIWVTVTPIGPTAQWSAPGINLVPSAARVALFTGFDPFYRIDASATTTQNVTSLSLVLFGVADI